jgi:EAL domain-containing protein (putative c-di-GMP-specific phosphodiesterase class I)
VAIYPVDGTEAGTLLGNADAAMYRAKEIGRDNFQFYTPKLSSKSHERLDLQEDLRKGIARSEFFLLYQPQLDLRTGKVLAVEALIRWNHPTLGTVSPARFIPVAEETGLIVSIGDWVLREACRQNRAWQDAGLPPISVGVNVSARQFSEKSMIAQVVRALRDSRLDPRCLELELTESLIMQDVEQAIATMQELQMLGVRLSIDDFGTGYSSLSALKSFPVARLKIDRSFIADLSRNQSDRAVTSAVISLGQKLHLRVIAEGVETDEQVAFCGRTTATKCRDITSASRSGLPKWSSFSARTRPIWAATNRSGRPPELGSRLSWGQVSQCRIEPASQGQVSQCRIECGIARPDPSLPAFTVSEFCRGLTPAIQPLRICWGLTPAFARDHARSARASFQTRSTTAAAGSARAIAADWPAHACIRCTSSFLVACARIFAVRPRCTGYGAGRGAPGAAIART